MSNFCGTCGTPRGSGKFCPSCGQRYDAPAAGAAPAPPAAPPASDERVTTAFERPAAAPSPAAPPPAPPTAPQQPAYAPPSGAPWQQPGAPAGQDPAWYAGATQQAPAAPPRPPVQLANPFKGVPVGDYVRDAAAVFLLFAALGVRWDAANDGGDRWWVVLASLLSIASLAVPYVVRAGAVPGFGAVESRLVKLVMNVPVAVAVLVALVNEAVAFDDPSEGGVGVAVGLLLAGALLAVQPRASELSGPHDAGFWSVVGRVLAIAAVALGVVTYVLHLVDDLTGEGMLFESPAYFAAELVSGPVLLLAVLGVPAYLMLAGGNAGRRVFAAAGFGVLVGALVSQANDGDSFVVAFGTERWNTPTGGTFLVGAAAALAAGHVMARRAEEHSRAVHPAEQWVRTASGALTVAAVTLGLSALLVVLVLVAVEDVSAAAIVVALLLAVAAGLLGVCVPMIADPRTSRPLALGLIGGELVVAIIVASVVRSQDVPATVYFLGGGDFDGGMTDFLWPALPAAITAYTFAALFVLPLVAAYALSVPEPVRTALGPLVTARTAQPGHPQPGHPQHGQPHHAQPVHPQQGYAPPGYPQPPQATGQWQQPTYAAPPAPPTYAAPPAPPTYAPPPAPGRSEQPAAQPAEQPEDDMDATRMRLPLRDPRGEGEQPPSA